MSSHRFPVEERGAYRSVVLYLLPRLLVQALIERELRHAMRREGIDELPLYPEERKTQRPTAEQILRLFSLVQRHSLQQEGQTIHTFNPELTNLQHQVLEPLEVPVSAYQSAS